MDQNGSLLEIESSNPKRSNKYNLFIKKTLKFLVPVSLLSFLLTYASCFSFIYTNKFHFSALVLPFFSHALERKYMFLICNGIIAFLAKTLSFNSCSSPPVTEYCIHDESMIKSTEVKPTLETSVVEKSVPFEETRLPVQYSTAIPDRVAQESQEEEEGEEDEQEVYITNRKGRYAEDKLEDKAPEGGEGGKSQTGSSLFIENEDIYSESEQEDDYETEETSSLLGASAEEEGNDINLNTEELNQKFEEFIRKMKEEIRIEAQQQLVVA